MTRLDALRKLAYAADDRYSRELVRAYGNNAGDARYKFSHADERVTAAMRAKLAADAALWNATDAQGDPKLTPGEQCASVLRASAPSPR